MIPIVLAARVHVNEQKSNELLCAVVKRGPRTCILALKFAFRHLFLTIYRTPHLPFSVHSADVMLFKHVALKRKKKTK